MTTEINTRPNVENRKKRFIDEDRLKYADFSIRRFNANYLMIELSYMCCYFRFSL